MDNSVERQEAEKQPQSGLFASLQLFERLINWLARFIQLTEEEQREAGIYIGHQRDE